MRTVITISLNGNAYQLDAVGFDALRAYLQVAEQRLAGNPDQLEILADLEQAIADKCSRYLGSHKNVISSEEVAEVLREMGPVDGGASESAAQGAGAAAGVGAGPGVNAGPGGGEMQGEPTRLTSMPRLLESRGLRAPEARRLAEQPRAEQRATRQRAERRGEQQRARRQRTVRHGAQRLQEARRGTRAR